MNDEEVVAAVFLVVFVGLLATICLVLRHREAEHLISHVATQYNDTLHAAVESP